MSRAGVITFLSVAVLAGCEVTNPGPIQDEFLQGDPLRSAATQQGMINGAIRAVAELYSDGSYTQALLAREIFPGGQTGSTGHNVIVQGGHLIPGDDVGYFGNAVEARFIAETAIKRFTEVQAPANMMYQAHLWAAYAYRNLGFWWCDAVVTNLDPDSREPGTYERGTQAYLNRAVTNFTAALAAASTDAQRHAARAGRAQARLHLGDYAGAAADAATVPTDFNFYITMDALETAYQNAFWEAQSGVFRSFSIRHTFFETYYTQTGDPRARWDRDPNPAYALATASLQGYSGGPANQRASVPFLRQRKYIDKGDDIRLAGGAEMRLIEAEALLRGATPNVTGAMTLINAVRTRNRSDLTGNAPLAPYTATTAVDAWSALKRERYIELWLEGHRLSDERRWAATNAPGSNDTPPFEQQSALFSQNPRSYCLDIPVSERDRNPNVPGLSG
jgi:hypothetical protein